MKTIQFSPNRITVDLILEVKKTLENHGVVAHPTETVYGLTANLYDEEAIARIYRIKKRPAHKPLSIMVHSVKEIEKITGGLSAKAKKLCKALFPGAITILLPLKKKLDIPFFDHLDYLGFRIPDYELCADMLTAVDFPLITTSANISNNKTPQLATEVMFEFGDEIDLLIDGGKTGSTSSTIIKYDNDTIEIIRQGEITLEEIKALDV